MRYGYVPQIMWDRSTVSILRWFVRFLRRTDENLENMDLVACSRRSVWMLSWTAQLSWLVWEPSSVLPSSQVISSSATIGQLQGRRRSIKDKGAKIFYLPPYSSDFNPIEQAFSKIKILLRKAVERSFDASRIPQLLRQLRVCISKYLTKREMPWLGSQVCSPWFWSVLLL